MTFAEVEDFVANQMRMSHVYQPVMLIALLTHDGNATEEQIARALLARDASQVDYYKVITRNMVGRVLRNRGVVTRDRKTKSYQLLGFNEFTPDEVERLISLCREKLEAFVAARGDQVWDHRRKGASYVSGTLRYEILKAAKGRCELCGISKDEKALEVDHIVPRNQGGSDDPSNLQALCYSCNAMKRDKDDTDFRGVLKSYDDREADCVFCQVDAARIVDESTLAYAIEDDYPVTEGHRLVIPRRHVASYFELGRPEVNACNELLSRLHVEIMWTDPEVSGFNVGINEGADAGQTIQHCHIHLIPRRAGDVEDPVGGVRAVIPGQANYLKEG